MMQMLCRSSSPCEVASLVRPLLVYFLYVFSAARVSTSVRHDMKRQRQSTDMPLKGASTLAEKEEH